MVRHRMLAPINTNKHYVHRANVTVASGTVSTNDVVIAAAAPATSTAASVRTGAIVKAIHFEYWLWNAGATGLDGQFTLIIAKQPSNLGNPTSTDLVNLGSWDNRKNILFSTQGVLGAGIDGSQAIPVIREWLLIPKGKQRMGLGDRIVVYLTPTGQSIQLCGLSTYKEYT